MFLAERFSSWNSNVCAIPTPVDTDRFQPAADQASRSQSTICWTGTSYTIRYLHAIEQALAIVLRRRPHRRFLILADEPPGLTAIPGHQIDFMLWHPHLGPTQQQLHRLGWIV